MTKINKHSLTLRCKRLANHAMLKNKLSIKRMKMAICDELHTSSSDDDNLPMLPPSSSSSIISLSPIEEENNSTSVSRVSTSSQSKYLSSFCNTSLSSLSSDGQFDRYKDLNDKFGDFEIRNNTFGCSSKERKISQNNGEGSSGENVIIDITSISKIHKSTQCDKITSNEDHQRHSIVVS